MNNSEITAKDLEFALREAGEEGLYRRARGELTELVYCTLCGSVMFPAQAEQHTRWHVGLLNSILRASGGQVIKPSPASDSPEVDQP